jgi:WD40 repeat protein
VIIGGYNSAAATVYNADGTPGPTLAFAGGQDIYIAKYSSIGTVIWVAAQTTTSFETISCITTDTSGDIFITGRYGGALTLSNANTIGGVGPTLALGGGGNAVFVAKYSSAGAVVWATRAAAGSAASGSGVGIATDSSGNVFVTGNIGAATTFYNAPGTLSGGTLASIGSSTTGFLAKYSSVGAVIWLARFGGDTYGSGQGIGLDTSGDVFFTGSGSNSVTFYNANTLGGASAATTVNLGVQDVFVAKYSTTGALSWVARIGGTGNDIGKALAIDPSGNVLITGHYDTAAITLYNANTLGAGSGGTLPLPGGSDFYIAKYSSAGAVVWAARIASAGNELSYGIATDASGNVFATGYYSGGLTLFNTGGTTGATLPFVGGQDVFIAKYNPDGFITAPTPANSNVLVDATYLPSTMSPFINGTSTTTLAGTTLATTGLYLGGPTNYFNGTLSELIIYASTLTAAQRQAVEGYLASKWGLRPSLISTQPYKILPPATSV